MGETWIFFSRKNFSYQPNNGIYESAKKYFIRIEFTNCLVRTPNPRTYKEVAMCQIVNTMK